MYLNEIANLFGQTGSTQEISGFSIDTRTLKSNEVFIAIKGEHFDGHQFLEEAQNKGALAVMAEKFSSAVNIPQIIVPNCVAALAKIAAWHRAGISCPIIALTGSNGKTSVKEMIASILPKPSFSTPGNLNNHLGVPLSLLKLHSEHQYAVFELGANHLGEIAYTGSLVQPQVALINNIGPAHIGEFGSLDDIARAKGEIYQVLDNGMAIVNDDDDYAHFWDKDFGKNQVLRFSYQHEADVYARNISSTQSSSSFELVLPTGSFPVNLLIPGEHSIANALAAAACTYAVGISPSTIVQGLSQFRGVLGRMTFLAGKRESTVIDDTYNANLKSTLMALEVLAKQQGQRILVLGDMGELGDWSQAHHEEVGLTARRLGINKVFTYGQHSEHSSRMFGFSAKHYTDQNELAQDLLDILNNTTVVLIKGSRFLKMEKIVQQLVG